MRFRQPYKQPRFQGPTSSAFGLDVAKNTLQNMGYPGLVEGGESTNTQDDTPLGSPPSQTQPLLSGSSRDPLWSVKGEEAVRLCNVYHEEMVRAILICTVSNTKTSLGPDVPNS
jgi:hypothetical protein